MSERRDRNMPRLAIILLLALASCQSNRPAHVWNNPFDVDVDGDGVKQAFDCDDNNAKVGRCKPCPEPNFEGPW